MLDIKLIQLKDQQLFSALNDRFDNYVMKFDEVKEADWFVKNFGQIIASISFTTEVSPELVRGYQRLLLLNSFISLSFRSEDEIIDLFKDHFSLVLIMPEWIDLWSKLKVVLLSYYDHEDRDGFKKRLLGALEHNQEVITTKKLIVSNKEIIATIGNWLLDYRIYVGSDSNSSIKKAEYLTNSSNIKSLDNIERNKLTRLIGFVERLKLSSLTPEGIEEAIGTKINGREVSFVDGSVQQINPEVIKLMKLMKEKGLIQEDLPLSLIGSKVKSSVDILELKPHNRVEANVVNLQSSPQVLKTPDPAFFFDLNDEKEADKFRGFTDNISGTFEKRLRELVEEVIQKNNFNFKDPTSKKRFAQLFVSYMKDVRDIVEVREMLTKTTPSGGLGLPTDKAEIVLNILIKVHADLPLKIQEWSKMSEQKVEQLPPEPFKEEKKEELPIAPIVSNLPPGVIAPPSIEPTSAESDQIMQKIIDSSPPPEIDLTLTKKLEDVKAPPRVLGPIEEIKSINLVDFRRLGKTPTQISEKIISKIQLIGETGIGRRYQAIRAWQASPIYRMYVDIGRQSIEQQKQVTDVIKGMQDGGRGTLTVGEFESVVDLNKKLRF